MSDYREYSGWPPSGKAKAEPENVPEPRSKKQRKQQPESEGGGE